jgi:hypothetical protein
MTKIAAYKPRQTPIPYDNLKGEYPPLFYVNHAETGGWHPKTKEISVITADFDEYSAEDALFNMTAAVEAGCVDSKTFVLDFFGTVENADLFADALQEYGESEFWVNERFFHAMVDALSAYEGSCRSFEAMADRFREKARDEADAFAKSKKPAAKKKAK